jgi:hypothetical protein
MQRRLAALTFLVLASGGVALAVGSDTPEKAPAVAAAKPDPEPGPRPAPRAELPRGGRRLFPAQRIVAYYGAPGNAELGALGIGTPDQAGKRLLAQMRDYRRGGRRLLRRWS